MPPVQPEYPPWKQQEETVEPPCPMPTAGIPVQPDGRGWPQTRGRARLWTVLGVVVLLGIAAWLLIR